MTTKANLTGRGLLAPFEATPWSRNALAAAGIDLATLEARIPPGHRLNGYARSPRGHFSFDLRSEATGRVTGAVAADVRAVRAALERLLGPLPETLEGQLEASLDRLGVRR